MCCKNTCLQGWGGGKAKAYFWVQGWVGVKKGCFGTYILYGWPHFMLSSLSGWFPQPVGENIFLQKLKSSLGFSLLGPNLYKRKDLCITPQGHFCLISGFNFELILFSKLFWDHPLALFKKIWLVPKDPPFPLKILKSSPSLLVRIPKIRSYP